MECSQFAALVSEYLDGDLDPVQVEAVRVHSVECARCRVVLSTTRQMLRMVNGTRELPLPEGASARLRHALEQGLDEPLVPAELRPAAARPRAPEPRRHGGLWNFGYASGTMRTTAWASAVLVVALAIGVSRWRASATTVSGWLIDKHCFPAFQNHPADHPRDCLLRCADMVYGVVDSKGHFTPFDAKGNKSALAAVKASTKPDHLWVTVKAKLTSSDVLEVQDLELTEPTTNR